MEEGDPTPIMRRMKLIEEQFMNNPILHDPAFNRKKETKEEDKVQVKGEHEQFTN